MGMTGETAKSRKKPEWVLKRIQHDDGVCLSFFLIPNLFRDLGFGFKEFAKLPRKEGARKPRELHRLKN
jgi:hypothetical protein